MEQIVMIVIVMMCMVGLMIAGLVGIYRDAKEDKRRAAWQAEMDALDAPKPEVYEVIGSYDYGKGKFTVELTTSWHNRHRRAPYYLRIISVEGSVVCTSDLYDNVDDAKQFGMGQVRWAGMLSGRIPAEHLHIY